MAIGNLLHVTKLEEFKAWLTSKGVAYRPGKGEYQVLQVHLGDAGWAVVYRRNNAREHFSLNQTLEPLVKRFIRETGNEGSSPLAQFAGRPW